MLESLEKLREAARNSQVKLPEIDWSWDLAVGECRWLNQAADAIQAEVDERYIELPLDAVEGPIHVGDSVAEYPYRPNLGEKPCEVVCMLLNSDGWAISDRDPFGTWAHPKTLVHAKPRTVEDVLMEFALECMTVKEVRNGVPVIGLDEGNVRDWLEEHDELQLRGDA